MAKELHKGDLVKPTKPLGGCYADRQIIVQWANGQYVRIFVEGLGFRTVRRELVAA